MKTILVPTDFSKPAQWALEVAAGIARGTLNVYNDRSEEEGILNFAATINADLIAMATHGRTGLSHALIGSIAEDVVNHSKRPVLTYVTAGL
jgi:nucleotide-binding universal stress UspA family protein